MSKDFLNKIIPLAVADEWVSSVPAEVTVGQAIVESAWGESQLAVLANNLFGIKAGPSWQGETIAMQGYEIIKGRTLRERMLWRKYDNIAASVSDHSTFLHKPRYAGAFKGDGTWQTFLEAIWSAGYATDPKYVNTITNVLQRGDILIRIANARASYAEDNRKT